MMRPVLLKLIQIASRLNGWIEDRLDAAWWWSISEEDREASRAYPDG